jgi:hypothetical protein
MGANPSYHAEVTLKSSCDHEAELAERDHQDLRCSMEIERVEFEENSSSASCEGRRSVKWWLVCGGILCVAAFVLMPGLNWSGAALASVEVTAVDATTGRPISNAKVQAFDYTNTPFRDAQTDTTGHATVAVFVGAGGERNWLYRRTGFGADDQLIEVAAEGYCTQRVAPGHGSTDSFLGFGGNARLRVRVALRPTTQP